jgi:molybdopterin-guanine dinucleotide biosynthesis protein A
MRRDKAVLLYQGKSQLDRAFELAGRHVAKVFVSVRRSQMTEPTRAQRPLIVDSVEGEGPIVGIRSALAAYPDVAWLVLACDLPFLSDAALEQLLTERDPSVLATAYASAYDGLPEPLCAVWEPAAALALSAYQSGGGRCPRKFLGSHRVRLIEPRDRHALDNVNTPEEYAQAQGTLDSHTPLDSLVPVDSHVPVDSRALFDYSHVHRDTMQLKIQYFALMREQAGRSEETVETSAATPADLFSELNARYGFTLSREQLKVAVNSEFSEWTRRLSAGDAVVFIPPVAGG